MRGKLADLAATGIASEPSLRKWIEQQPDQPWIIKRGSRGDAYEIDIPGAVKAWQEKEELAAQVARDRVTQIKQLALDLGIASGDQEPTAELSILERRQLLEEELVAMKLAERRGELISFVAASAALGEVLIRVRELGETLAARISKKVDLSREQIAAIDSQMERDHAKLADWMAKAEDQLGDGTAGTAADTGASLADPAI